MTRQKEYYLEELGINKGQEEALVMICNEMWPYQLNYPFIYFDNNCEMCITHPFYEDTGRFWGNPIETYGDGFINSEFVAIAKSFELTDSSKDAEIIAAVKTKLGEFLTKLIKKKLGNNNTLSQSFVNEMSKEISTLVTEFATSLNANI